MQTIDKFNFAGKKGICSRGLQCTPGRKLQHHR